MQQKEQNISPLKQKILHYLESIGLSHRKFYEKTGVSRGTLTNKSGISEETLAKIFAAFPKLKDILYTEENIAANIAAKIAANSDEIAANSAPNLDSDEPFPSDAGKGCKNCWKLEQDIFFLRDVIKGNNLSIAHFSRENERLQAENGQLRAELAECCKDRPKAS